MGESGFKRDARIKRRVWSKVYKLAQDIEGIEDVARESGLSPDSSEWPKCRQVKKKIGSLRFVIFAVKDYEAMNERISELRIAALNQSFSICEECDINEITP